MMAGEHRFPSDRQSGDHTPDSDIFIRRVEWYSVPVESHPARLREYGVIAIAIAHLILLAACGKTPDAGPAPNTAVPLPVSMIEARLQTVPITVETVGQTEGAKEIEVRARVSGILLKQFYTEGDPIRAGAILFKIDPEPYAIALEQARAVLAQEQAKRVEAQLEVKRLQPLLAKNYASQQAYDQAEANLQASQAAVQVAQAAVRQAELNLSYTDVTAPIGGTSGRALHSIGALVTVNADSALLTTISQTDPIWARFSLSPQEYQTAKSGLRAPTVRLILPDGREYAEPGRLNFAASTVDTRLATVQLRAAFPNPRLEVLPGQFVRVRLGVGEQSAILVPQIALQQDDQGRFVWTVDSAGKAARRPVEVGNLVERAWIVRQGLNVGDRVIVDNLIKLRPGLAIEPRPAPAPNGPAPATKP